MRLFPLAFFLALTLLAPTSASAQPATQPAPVQASNPASKFPVFLATWRGNGLQLDVHADTSATMTITPGDVDPATPTKLTLKFLTTNYGGTGVSAAVQVVASNSPRNFPVGATGTFVL